jgi:hypothetical protein
MDVGGDGGPDGPEFWTWQSALLAKRGLFLDRVLLHIRGIPLVLPNYVIGHSFAIT